MDSKRLNKGKVFLETNVRVEVPSGAESPQNLTLRRPV